MIIWYHLLFICGFRPAFKCRSAYRKKTQKHLLAQHYKAASLRCRWSSASEEGNRRSPPTLSYSSHADIAPRTRVLSSLWLISSWAARSAAAVLRVCGWACSRWPTLTETTNGIQAWLCGLHLDRSCLHRACVCHHKLASKHRQTTSACKCACKHVYHICKSTSRDKRGNLAWIILHFRTK